MIAFILLLNTHGFLLLNQLGNIAVIRDIVVAFAFTPILLIPVFLASFWLYYTKKKDDEKKGRLLFIFYAVMLAFVINLGIQQFVFMPRPLELLKNGGHFILSHVADNSFPSDHASAGIAFVTSLFLFDYAAFWYGILPLFIVMLLSRVIGGVHYPLDILWGTLVGILSGYCMVFVRNNPYVLKCNNGIIRIARFFRL